MDDLNARVAHLEAMVAELRVALERSQARIRTMRHTATCPSCGHGRVLHFKQIPVSGNTRGGLLPLSLDIGRSWAGLVTPGDPIEAYVCRACGLLEWHASSLEELEPDGENVRELVRPEPETPNDPYR